MIRKLRAMRCALSGGRYLGWDGLYVARKLRAKRYELRDFVVAQNGKDETPA
jgi:hypothetical protein